MKENKTRARGVTGMPHPQAKWLVLSGLDTLLSGGTGKGGLQFDVCVFEVTLTEEEPDMPTFHSFWGNGNLVKRLGHYGDKLSWVCCYCGRDLQGLSLSFGMALTLAGALAVFQLCDGCFRRLRDALALVLQQLTHNLPDILEGVMPIVQKRIKLVKRIKPAEIRDRGVNTCVTLFSIKRRR